MKKAFTLDHWAKKIVLEFAISKKCEYLSHGKDIHPYVDNPGLSLFKMRSGCHPVVSSSLGEGFMKKNDISTIEINIKELCNKYDFFIYFTKQDNNGLYKIINIYHKKSSNSGLFVNEFVKVSNWLGLKMEIMCY